VTDQSEAEPLANSLRTNASSPMSYSNNLRSALPASILEEDKIVQQYPLKVNKVTIISSDQPFTGKERMPKKTM
jgi:zinc protease